MNSCLLLYIDEYILVPVSYDADGHSHEAGIINYSDCGDYSYVEKIKDFFYSTTGLGQIDVHYLFAESLELKRRKEIIDALLKEGFRPIAYRGSSSLILTDYAVAQGLTSTPDFGDIVVLLYSSSDSLRITGSVFDGRQWQWNTRVERVGGVGDSPLKRAIVECVVDERDKASGFLVNSKSREEEIQYQSKNSEDWLLIYKNDSPDLLIRDYRYHFDSKSSYIVRLSKNIIEQHYERSLAPAVSCISDYVKASLSALPKLAVFIGPAFEDERFAEKAKIATGCKDSVYIPYTRLSSVLSAYSDKFDYRDDYSLFDERMEDDIKNQKTVLEWIGAASKMYELSRAFESGLLQLSQKVSNDKSTVTQVLSKVDLILEHCEYDEASKVLNSVELPAPDTKFAVSEARRLLVRKEKMMPILEKLKAVPGAREVIHEIDVLVENVNRQLSDCKENEVVLNEKKEKVLFYKNHEQEALELKNEFHRAHDFKTKKDLVKAMAKVMPPSALPALRLNQVAVELFGEKQRVKTGLFSRKESLHVGMKVLNDEELPCDAVLNVSRKVVIRATEEMPGCLAFQVEKGRRDFSVDIDFPVDGLDFKEPVYVCLFVGKDVLDKQAVKCNCLTIK